MGKNNRNVGVSPLGVWKEPEELKTMRNREYLLQRVKGRLTGRLQTMKISCSKLLTVSMKKTNFGFIVCHKSCNLKTFVHLFVKQTDGK